MSSKEQLTQQKHTTHDMKKVAGKQHIPILTGLKALAVDRGWEVEIVPLIAGQRSVREKEWLEALKTFRIGAEDGKRIIYRLEYTLLNEHEKLFGSYCRQTLDPLVVSYICWGRVFRAGPISRPRIDRSDRVTETFYSYLL